MSQIMRGSSTRLGQLFARSPFRYGFPPGFQDDVCGFRIAKRRGHSPTIRGSSYDYDHEFTNCALRFWGRPEARRILRGFRVSRRKP